MGPTCSIIYENEPLEKNSMQRPPRIAGYSFLSWRELSTSLVQGLGITAGTLFSYQYAVQHGYTEDLTRSMVFTSLVVANIFLTLVNRSFYYSIITSMGYRNNMLIAILLITTCLLLGLLYVPMVSGFFHLQAMAGYELMLASFSGFISVIWFELYKWRLRLKSRQ
jgi:Ca2+-transporting ATPase